MSRRKSRSRPPTSSGYKSGQVLTFATLDGAPRPTELIELVPAGPPPQTYELKPEDECADIGEQPPLIELTSAGAPATRERQPE